MSVLSIINQANGFSLNDEASFVANGGYAFECPFADGTNVFVAGYIHPDFVPFFKSHGRQALQTDDQTRRIRFLPHLKTMEERQDAVHVMFVKWCQEPSIVAVAGCLKKWRNEHYQVFDPNGDVCLLVERCCSGMLGVRQYGCHLNAYLVKDDQMHMWIAKRSKSKQTYPGMLDNIVGGNLSLFQSPFVDPAFSSFMVLLTGGLTAGLTPLQVMQKECVEEASFPQDIISTIQPVSMISFFSNIADRGLLPESEFVFDVFVPDGFQPVPLDGEVESFELMPIDKVLKCIQQGLFMPASALVVIDFMIRHGLMTAENQIDYMDIVSSIHRHLSFPCLRVTSA